jgi:hypothetical protein
VIQGRWSKIATGESRVARSKILVNQWKNEQASRHQLGHHPAFTKNDTDGEVVFKTASMLKPQIFNSSPNMSRAYFRLRQQYQK